ncbi:ABC transporter ATP-binding protein [Actinokineospora sp. G85]|uniref:ABC transporter ATP-binding protein n=1 Tax=Actinokineospora sp. G85 TaxID=3406626 RepID=UPI003C722CA1
MTLLAVRDLTVSIGGTALVDGVSFTLDPGERLGLIGESGSGKSLTALAVLGLLPAGATVTGSITLDGQELVGLGDRRLSALRGRELAMVFQEPRTALDPLMRVGRQVAEPLHRHGLLSRRAARARAVDLLADVGLPDPAHTARAYPHQLSGGQLQRVGIAAALACEPALLLADEPTTALDVTVQAEILALLDRLVDERGSALVFITHDMAVLARVARRVLVLGKGAVLEEGDLDSVLRSPGHEYTRTLLAAARAASFRQEV